MPCDSIVRNKVDLKLADYAQLERALKAAPDFSAVSVNAETRTAAMWHGPTFQSVSIRDGSVTVRKGTEHIADEIRRAYSFETLRVAAESFGWSNEIETATSGQLVKEAF